MKNIYRNDLYKIAEDFVSTQYLSKWTFHHCIWYQNKRFINADSCHIFLSLWLCTQHVVLSAVSSTGIGTNRHHYQVTPTLLSVCSRSNSSSFLLLCSSAALLCFVHLIRWTHDPSDLAPSSSPASFLLTFMVWRFEPRLLQLTYVHMATREHTLVRRSCLYPAANLSTHTPPSVLPWWIMQSAALLGSDEVRGEHFAAVTGKNHISAVFADSLGGRKVFIVIVTLRKFQELSLFQTCSDL